jgi:hypothetical protein
MSDQKDDDQLPDDEIVRRMERGIRRFLNTPPQPRGKNPKDSPPRKERPAPKDRACKAK